MIKKIAFGFMLVALVAGCQRTSVTPPPPITPIIPPDTTVAKQKAVNVDSVMTIYVGKGGTLYSVNARTGAVNWNSVLGTTVEQSGEIIFSAPLYYNGMIYATTQDLMNIVLHAVDTTGKERWSVTVDSGVNASNICAYNGMVYLSTEFSTPVAYDAKTGTVRWAFQTTGLYPESSGGSINLKNGVLYFLNRSFLFAIDATSGQQSWLLQNQTDVLPAFTSNKLILDYNGAHQAINPLTTAVIWQQVGRLEDAVSVEPYSMFAALGNAYVYYGGVMDAIDTATGATKFSLNAGSYNGLFTSTDSLLFFSYISGISCFNALNGNLEWTLDPGITAYQELVSNVAALNGVMYYSFDYFYARNISTQQIIWKTLLENNDDWSYSTPCLVTKSGKVYQGGNNF